MGASISRKFDRSLVNVSKRLREGFSRKAQSS